MVTRIFLIRHGATVLSSEDRFAGASDVALSKVGIKQAKKLGQRLAEEKISAVYCSDMHRAVRTAMAVAKPHGLTPIQRPALREINHGHWEGMIHKEVEKKFAKEYLAWDTDPLLAAPPGGESGLSVLARSMPALRQIILDHPDQTVAIVAHKATNRLLLTSILGIDPRLYRERLTQDPACLNVLCFNGDPANGEVVVMNDTSHYAKKLR